MPYNTTAIPPRKEVTGQTQLPLTRVKKIIAMDQDVQVCSNNAAFVITLATEMFVQHLAQEGHNMAKAEKKPRRNIQYKDLASAVASQENLEFLEDVIPKTTTYRQIKQAAAAMRAQVRGEKGDAAAAAPNGGDDREPPPPTNGKKQKSIVNGVNGFARRQSTAGEGSDDPNAQLEMEMQAEAARGQDSDVDMTG